MDTTNIFARILFCAITTVAPFHLPAAPVADYAAITRNVRSIPMSGTAGGLAVIGRLALPLAISAGNKVTVAAGYHDDDANAGRIVGFAHTSLSDPESAERRNFLANIVKWSGRATAARLGCGRNIRAQEWQRAGFNAKPIGNAITETSLKRFDVILLSLHDNSLPGAVPALRKFVQNGKGILITGTPWAARKEVVEAVNEFISEAGLAFHGEYSSDKSFPVHRRLPSPYWSALVAIDAIGQHQSGRKPLDRNSLIIAARSVEEALGVRPSALGLADHIKSLSDAVGWIQPTQAKPLVKDRNPIGAMLARYQANILNTLPADRLPAHPAASDWPGSIPSGAATVSRTLNIRASAPSNKLVNSGHRGKRINTGLYAIPGQAITITIPAAAAEAGLSAQIGIHVDKTFHLRRWNRFPQISREWKLSQTVTKAAGAFGGLVIIGVPPGCQVGNIRITVEGAVAAPAFVLGQHSNEQWNARIKNAPGAWGYIESRDFCSYLPRSVLTKTDDPERIARYWQQVIETADRYLGYADWRKRGEGGYTDRDISAGYGHAGYPVVMAYGDKDWMATRGPEVGDWGFLHEIGHTFQDSFDGNYTIATHAEVDVNLVPAIAKMHLHDVTCIDNNSHNTFNAKPRLAAVKLLQAAPPAEQTWDRACKTPAAYDFYFTLAECFGWDLYGRAFGRLMNFLNYASDEPELKGLNKRDRFFLLFCQESGHNLLPHFKKYGLGKGKFPISTRVIAKVESLPHWSGNRPLKLSSPPLTLELPQTGNTVHHFKAVDPDPGTIFTWTIESGNDDGAFALNKRTGVLSIANPSVSAKPHRLKIKVSDSTVPESTATTTVTVR